MNDVIVTKDVLDLFDKYEGDFELLHERWASKKDREKVTWEQQRIISEYVDKLEFLKVDALSAKMRADTEARVLELEAFIDSVVIEIIRTRSQKN